ncbi:DNA repair protein RecO [Bienertia sinuspersici]
MAEEEVKRWHKGFEEDKEMTSICSQELTSKRKKKIGNGRIKKWRNQSGLMGQWNRNEGVIRKELTDFRASPLQAEAYALLEGPRRQQIMDYDHHPDGLREANPAALQPGECAVQLLLLILDILNVLKTFDACKVLKVSRSCVEIAHDLAIQARSCF